MELARLGRFGGDSTADLIWKELPKKPVTAFIPYILFVVAIGTLLLFAYDRSIGFLAWLTVFAVNAVCHTLFQRRILGLMEPIGYLGRMLTCATRLVKQGGKGLSPEYTHRLSECLEGSRHTAIVSRMQSDDILFNYMNMYFLIQARAFFSVLQLVEKYRRQLQDIYETLGLIDAMQAIASFRGGGSRNPFVTPA